MTVTNSTLHRGGMIGEEGERVSLGSLGPRLFRFMKNEPLQAVPLVFLTLLAAGLGLAVLDQPIRCDEAGTYLDFVRYGVAHVISSYSSTNNHILYSLAAKVSVKLFGAEPWAIRLPALVAGVLLVPATYLALRAHFANSVALLGAGLVATNPYLTDQATNGRGYTILNVCFMLLLALSPYLLRTRRLGPWLLFAVLGAIGAYAVPIMVFPLGIVGIWLVVGILLEVPRGERLPFAGTLLLASLGVAVLVGLLYAPTVFGHGAEKAILVNGPRFDSSLEVMTRLDRVLGLGHWLAILWEHALHGLPRSLAWGSLGMAILGLFAGRRSGLGLRFFLASALGFAGVVFVSGRQPPMWSMSFLIPLYLGLAAGGAGWLGKLLFSGHRALVPTLALVVFGGAQVAAGMRNDGRQGELPWYMGYYDAEEASLRIDEDLPPRSPIVGIGRQLATIYFYQDSRGDKTPGNADRDGFLVAREAFLIDSGVAKSNRLVKGLDRWGFEATDEIIQLENSRIVRFEMVRDPPQKLLDQLPDRGPEEDGELIAEDDGGR